MYFILLILISSCSILTSNPSNTESSDIRSIVDQITLNIPYKENHHRIFANTFYDMTANHSRISSNKHLSVDIDIQFNKMPSGASTSGVIMQYTKQAILSYKLVLNKSSKPINPVSKPINNNQLPAPSNTQTQYTIYQGIVQSSAQYSGSPIDLFAEYTAELNAQDNVARQIAREFYYNLLIAVRLHVARCKSLKPILDAKKLYVFANDKIDDDSDNTKTLDEIDTSDLKKIDYKIYENACNII
ncbi:hypothetical protein [Candidatus Deianiraea vastatrix]|uniref:Lipoprotein n=1 Tax=Candidatus Deianiraea vastatrix TaxID=2163644 RepID=A0A5B8XFI3_9RICK|nr:hypothetical protein [Candidatus Deianiraea vastatrix]QED23685.1 hypothetical protein Deia_00898 [Candidatus Deianiraea vastatrix]